MFRFSILAAVFLGMGLIACFGVPVRPYPGQVWRDSVSGVDLCYCPPGSFLMGSTEGEPYHVTDQKPRHQVMITRGFWIGRDIVSRAQWRVVMGDLSASSGAGDGPLSMVSWLDCQDFLLGLNRKAGRSLYRLPTEAEWEYACKAGKPWFGDIQGEIERREAEAQEHPNAWGLVHMLGSRRQWCSDWMGRYPSGPAADPVGPGAGSYRINRGGSSEEKSFRIHPAYRWYYTPDFRDDDLGFRIVRIAE